MPDIPGMIFAVPRMSYYLKMSSKVISIFLEYVSKEDLHIYSVDEAFLNIGPYLRLYGMKASRLVQKIQKEIKDKLGLTATAGIGPNMFLAKMALDHEGKKKEPYIAEWGYPDVEKKLWGISRLDDVWSIGKGTASHLKRIGIRNLEMLAKADDELLKKEFGIIGLQLKDLANGIDGSDFSSPYLPKEKSLSLGQTLRRPCAYNEARLLLMEMNDELSMRLSSGGYMASKVSLWMSYEDFYYAKEISLPYPSDDQNRLYEALLSLFVNNGKSILSMGISYGKLSRSKEIQLGLGDDFEKYDENKRLNSSFLKIRKMYGDNAALRCSSLLPYSTIRERHQQIGGHRE